MKNIKNSVIKVRLTDEEHELLHKECDDLGFKNLSVYIRSLIYTKKKKSRGEVSSLFTDGKALKNQNLKIRFTEDEYKRINNEYDQLKFSSFSAYLRFLISSKKVEIVFSPSDEELSRVTFEKNRNLKNQNYQLAKIGNNINQIAKSINTENIVGREQVDFIKQKLNEILKLYENNVAE